MSTTVSWPPIGGTSYSVPASGEINWPNLSNYLIALQNAQGTAAQKVAVRIATTSPVTVASPTDFVVVTQLAAPGPVAVNLPAGVNGQMFCIVDGTGDALTNNITITPNGAETINGASNYVIASNSAGIIMAYKSTNWTIISEFNNFSAGSIPRSVIAAATPNYVVINDGTGKLSEEQYLSKARGGAGADQSTVTYPSTGVIVTEAASETLTNKSLDGNSNTFSNIAISTLKTVLADADKVIRRDATGAVISGNALTNNSQIVTTDSTDTLTNKSIDGATNTLSNIDLPSLKTVLADANKVIRRDASGVVVSDNAVPNSSQLVTLDSTDDLSNKSFITTTTVKAANQLNFNNAGDTFHTSLAAGANVADLDLLLPIADGTGGQALVTDGAGQLSFTTISATQTANVRASEGAGTTTLTSVDNREQVFDLTAGRTVVLPTTGVVKGDVWIMDNPNAFVLTVQASDASQIVLAYGAKVEMVALVNTPVANTDWEVTLREIIYGAEQTPYTPTLPTNIVYNATNSGSFWWREGEYLCARGDINFSTGTSSDTSVGSANIQLPISVTINVSDYPNGTTQSLGTHIFKQTGNGLFFGACQWLGSNLICFANGWEASTGHVIQMSATSFNTNTNYLAYEYKIRVDEFKWN